MNYKEATQLVNSKMSNTDKLLAMMEALHEAGQDRLLELMRRDLKDNGIEND
jgi:hypothetical protein